MGIVERIGDRIRYQILGMDDREAEFVFGIGLSRTATSSLAEALRMLGYPAKHYPPIARVEGAACRLDWPWWMNRFRAATDIPVSATYRELARRFPNAKFVLTLRDEDQWLHSCERHFTPERFEAAQAVPRFAEGLALNRHLYGANVFEEALFRERFRRHAEEAEAFLSGTGRLLAADFCGKQGWEALCGFLGKPAPDAPFPRTNARPAGVYAGA